MKLGAVRYLIFSSRRLLGFSSEEFNHRVLQGCRQPKNAVETRQMNTRGNLERSREATLRLVDMVNFLCQLNTLVIFTCTSMDEQGIKILSK